jgi:hypothetical protein
LPFGPTPGQLGPPDPAGVLRSLEHALEAARRARRPMTLVALELPPPPDEESLAAVARRVRTTVRDTDGLWRDGDCSLLLLLTDCDGPNSEPALARLRLRLRAERRNDLAMGRAAPPPGIGAEDLLLLARADCRPIAHGGRRPA